MIHFLEDGYCFDKYFGKWSGIDAPFQAATQTVPWNKVNVDEIESLRWDEGQEKNEEEEEEEEEEKDGCWD